MLMLLLKSIMLVSNYDNRISWRSVCNERCPEAFQFTEWGVGRYIDLGFSTSGYGVTEKSCSKLFGKYLIWQV